MQGNKQENLKLNNKPHFNYIVIYNWLNTMAPVVVKYKNFSPNMIFRNNSCIGILWLAKIESFRSGNVNI